MVISDACKYSWGELRWGIEVAFESYLAKLDTMVADYAWASMMACNIRSSAEECRLYCRDSAKLLRKVRRQSMKNKRGGYTL